MGVTRKGTCFETTTNIILHKTTVIISRSDTFIAHSGAGSHPDPRMCHQRILNVPEPIGIGGKPLHGRFQPLLPTHLLLPTQLVQLAAVNCVPQIVELSIGDEADELFLLIALAQNFDQFLGHLQITDFVIPPDVVNHPRLGLVQDDLEGARHVLHEEEVPRVAPVPVQRDRSSPQQLIGELGNELLGELMRSVHVVPPGDDAGQLEGSMVALDEELGPGLGGRVGIGWLQHVLLLHGLGLEGLPLAVHLVGGDVYESLHAAMALGGLEQHVRSEDVALGEVEGVAEGVVHVGLRGEVHDGVDPLLGHDVGHQVGGGDVPLDEFEVLEAGHLVEVGQAAAVVQLVVDHQVVVRVLLGQEDGHVGADEARPSRQQNVLRDVIRGGIRFEGGGGAHGLLLCGIVVTIAVLAHSFVSSCYVCSAFNEV